MARTRRSLLRQLMIWSDGAEVEILVADDQEASIWGYWRNAVNRFLDDNDVHHLDPVRGETIRDSSGRSFLLETRPNVLYRLDAAGRDNFEQIYKIVS